MIPKKLCKIDDKSMQSISAAVKGKKIVLVTKTTSPRCTYSVIGYYLYTILKLSGANIQKISVDSVKIHDIFDVGLYCNYETIPIIRSKLKILKSMRCKCGNCIFYANVVPSIPKINFDTYCVSRKEFLKVSSGWYLHRAYQKPDLCAMKRAFYVGRGVDPFFLVPSQNKFSVCVDAMRRRHIRKALDIVSVLRNMGIKVYMIGFNNQGHRLPRVSFKRIVDIYKRTSVYISTINGIFEMPLIESQCAGNNVISYQKCLPEELCCPKTTFICKNLTQIEDIICSLRTNIDRRTPRKFVSNWWWTKVVNKICGRM